MEEIREGLLYTRSHEWIKKNNDGTVTVGISDHAQHDLGDIVFAETPAEGKEVKAGSEMGAMESVKTVEPIYAPVSGKVVRSNSSLNDSPELLNTSPYDEGWIAVIKISNPEELRSMMDHDSYKAMF